MPASLRAANMRASNSGSRGRTGQAGSLCVAPAWAATGLMTKGGLKPS